MFSSSTVIVSTWTMPSSSRPSSVDTSFASIGLKPPRKVETPACSASNVALEWATSMFQVPAGTRRSVVAVVVI